MQIAKKTWITTTFGQVAIQQKADIDRESEKVDRYVAGEHMASEDLHIRQWGAYNGQYLGPAFRRKFEKSDILYGSRRTYLKKVAVAEFDGITANTTFVIKPSKKIVPGLLPFLMLSDSFTEHSIKHSKGSVNPYINWKDIANFTFQLPAKVDEQMRIANLLWGIDDAIEKKKILLEKAKQLFKTIVEKNVIEAIGKKILLRDIASKSVGSFVDGDWIESKDQSDDGIRLLQLADIGVNEFLDKSRRYISEGTFKRLNCFEVLPGDILLARMPDPIGRACIVPDIGSKMITAVDCCVIRIDEKLHNRLYWVYLFNSDFMKRKMEALASGTTRKRISRSNLETMQVVCHDKKDQDRIIHGLTNLTKNIDAISEDVNLQKQIQKQIINQIFG